MEDHYEPQEDSILLAKAVERFAFGKFLDLGCGSGIQGIAAAKSGKTNEIVFADLNENALNAAKKNFGEEKLQIKARFVKANLFSKLANEKFDVIAFNPPYLPTSREEKLSGSINLAFDGGKDGREVVDKFLQEFESHLNQKGILLLLNSSLSNNEKTIETLKQKNFEVEIVEKQDFFFEHLIVIKAWKNANFVKTDSF